MHVKDRGLKKSQEIFLLMKHQIQNISNKNIWGVIFSFNIELEGAKAKILRKF